MQLNQKKTDLTKKNAELASYMPMITYFGTDNNSQTSSHVHYDQFLITCSDDGSMNIYDVSSFSKELDGEFYTRGNKNTDRIYTPQKVENPKKGGKA